MCQAEVKIRGSIFMAKTETDDFRGLLYNPSYENEVVLLFGLLMPYLDSQFVIDEYSGSFPDCIALKNGKEIGIEFEEIRRAHV
jgi:hypothetical protein